MVNSTWTNRHINHLLEPFGWRDDTDEDEEVEAPPGVAEVSAEAPSVAVPERDESTEEGLRRRQASWKKEDPVETKRKQEEEAALERAAATKKTFRRATTVYPPCDTLALAALPLELRENVILSVAQFRCVLALLITRNPLSALGRAHPPLLLCRPEKEHHVQLQALRLLLDDEPKYCAGADRVQLILAGSVRNEGDEARVQKLRELAKELGVEVSYLSPGAGSPWCLRLAE